MSKFLQHPSVRVAGALSFASGSTNKSRQEFGQGSKGQSNISKANAITGSKRSFAKYKAGADITEPWSALYHSHAETHGLYLTLTEFDVPQVTVCTTLEAKCLKEWGEERTYVFQKIWTKVGFGIGMKKSFGGESKQFSRGNRAFSSFIPAPLQFISATS